MSSVAPPSYQLADRQNVERGGRKLVEVGRHPLGHLECRRDLGHELKARHPVRLERVGHGRRVGVGDDGDQHIELGGVVVGAWL